MNKKGLAFGPLILALYLQPGIEESMAQQGFDIVDAAEAGTAQAQFILGTMYNSGRGQRKDLRKAIGWFRRAANQGHGDALFNVGAMIESGRGTRKNIREAAKWYMAAARAGNVEAMYTLSKMYSSGNGVPRNENKAKSWYEKAIGQWEGGDQSGSNDGYMRH